MSCRAAQRGAQAPQSDGLVRPLAIGSGHGRAQQSLKQPESTVSAERLVWHRLSVETMQETVGFAIGAPCLVALTLKLPYTVGDALRQRSISLETVAQHLDKTIAVELCLHLTQLKCRHARATGHAGERNAGRPCL